MDFLVAGIITLFDFYCALGSNSTLYPDFRVIFTSRIFLLKNCDTP